MERVRSPTPTPTISSVCVHARRTRGVPSGSTNLRARRARDTDRRRRRNARGTNARGRARAKFHRTRRSRSATGHHLERLGRAGTRVAEERQHLTVVRGDGHAVHHRATTTARSRTRRRPRDAPTRPSVDEKIRGTHGTGPTTSSSPTSSSAASSSARTSSSLIDVTSFARRRRRRTGTEDDVAEVEGWFRFSSSSSCSNRRLPRRRRLRELRTVPLRWDRPSPPRRVARNPSPRTRSRTVAIHARIADWRKTKGRATRARRLGVPRRRRRITRAEDHHTERAAAVSWVRPPDTARGDVSADA